MNQKLQPQPGIELLLALCSFVARPQRRKYRLSVLLEKFHASSLEFDPRPTTLRFRLLHIVFFGMALWKIWFTSRTPHNFGLDSYVAALQPFPLKA
ncbi:hypothetical protein VNO78_23838 [Psophocarpus tetragonolobus]|uniref:Uncharacterized protein n=1 Tax=Psophocarpus tetragonolobus TaxID=3891 RepID=A0AAN9XE86_PSOTE